MSKNMLIDAAHAEETRVAVVDGHTVEEFDFESRAKKQLRGNIYLAKVTRVEPSLQAAFVEYGGNRHGFLAFNEIHPDYYQIPVADRQAIMAEADDEDDLEHAEDHDDDDEGVSGEEAKLRRRLMRRYKIQEVIKRRQILLVQVVKEERGTKGAALTTYLSLAGRYCVLMPNTARGGGISRKITQATDRKRLKAAAQSLEVPQGMGLIIRTAGAKRTKQEIKRDYEYLLRLWESVRERTLKSNAPSLIYEEEDLVKRAIRDMFDKDVDAILVDGEDGFREAREFMRMIMPSQAKKIQLYREPTPLFAKYKVEDVLQQIHSPVVALRSGGYLVINQTEALVAVDVNSGRATKERNIEATALKTNMEAAEEAARQLRLRDLAGLIVIDFIDMDEAKNNRSVEKRLKDSLAEDRARVQMGKISPFGLMEISRQRRRSGILEGSTHVCEHCLGAGRVRSVESAALQALRAVEMELVKGGAGAIKLKLAPEVAFYILNEKRIFLMRLQEEAGLFVNVQADAGVARAEQHIERTESTEHVALDAPVRGRGRYSSAPSPELEDDFIDVDEDDEDLEDEDDHEDADEDDDEDQGEGEVSSELRAQPRGEHGAAPTDPRGDRDGAEGRGRRRRRRRRGGRDEFETTRAAPGEASDVADDEGESHGGEIDRDAEREDQHGHRRRRRGRRGGRRMREPDAAGAGAGRDGYVWVRGRTPSLDDPYVWFDPIEMAAHGGRPRADAVAAGDSGANRNTEEAPSEGRGRRDRGRRQPEASPRPAVEDQPASVAASAAQPDFPEAEIPAPKRRRVRTRKAVGGDGLMAAPEPESLATPDTASAEGEVSPPAASSPAAENPAAEAPEMEPAAQGGPVLELVTAPAAAQAAPTSSAAEPVETSSPPAEPKRGWWRRRL